MHKKDPLYGIILYSDELYQNERRPMSRGCKIFKRRPEKIVINYYKGIRTSPRVVPRHYLQRIKITAWISVYNNSYIYINIYSRMFAVTIMRKSHLAAQVRIPGGTEHTTRRRRQTAMIQYLKVLIWKLCTTICRGVGLRIFN